MIVAFGAAILSPSPASTVLEVDEYACLQTLYIPTGRDLRKIAGKRLLVDSWVRPFESISLEDIFYLLSFVGWAIIVGGGGSDANN